MCRAPESAATQCLETLRKRSVHFSEVVQEFRLESNTLIESVSVPMALEKPPAKKPRIGQDYESTALPANWTHEERVAYSEFWKEATDGTETPSADQLTEYFLRSGLTHQALNEVWQVANPDLKPSLGEEEFRVCCRLMGHCQTLGKDSDDVSITRALKKGGHKLRSLLRGSCLSVPPLGLPKFS